ncbi:MAG: DNA primase, partial [Oscillospiraceae bacterium]|nr:DNA primase [Oscillospiraceae bacterium]
MAKLSEEFINQLKEANPIVDVFNSYAELKKRGRIYVCCCPFHVEKTPSCTIYPDTHSFYCFGCGESGDVITLLMKMDDLSYMNAVRTLANRAGMTLPIQNKQEHKFQISYDKCYEINRETANFYYNKLLRGTDKSGLQFLAAHRIRPQTVKKFGIGFASDDPQQLLHYLRSKNYSENELLLTGVCRRNPDGSLSDYFRNQILFPVIDLRGNITGFTGKIIPGEESHWSVTPENAVFSRKKLLFSLNIARYAIAETASKTIILAQDALNA